MNQKTNLYSIWNVSGSESDVKSVKTDEFHTIKTKESILSSGEHCYFIVDIPEQRISHINHSFKCVLGLDTNSMSLEKMNKLIHPDDISFVELAETSIRNYFAEHVSSETIGDYKASYCLRLLTTSGNYQLYHHQSMALAVDSKGNCIQTLNILNNINNLTPANNYRVTVQNLKNNHFVELDIYAKKQTIGLFPIFSKRETEIIRLMSLGLKNPEIAQRLFISLHTVKNHRKNILHKAQVHTSSELIALCIHQGLI